MPMTAERLKKNREKLKHNEEVKRKQRERMNKRKLISLVTEAEKKKIREQWQKAK